MTNQGDIKQEKRKYIPPHLRSQGNNEYCLSSDLTKQADIKQVVAELNVQHTPNYIGKTNDIYQELNRLQQEFPDHYKPLIKRDIVKISKDETENKSLDDNKINFNIMQFNALADGLSGAHSPLNPVFVHSDRACVHFKYRGFRLIEEIVRFKPDIITVQEIDQIDFFYHYLSPFGYEYVYTTKPSSPCCRIGKTLKLNLPPDGSAVFWNRKIFSLVKSYKYGKHVDPKSPKDIRNLAASVVHLRHNTNKNKQIIVASTHLKASISMQADRQRIRQLLYLLPALKKLCENNNDIPLFIGTDFNSPSETIGSYFPYAYQSVMNGQYLLNKLNNFVDKQEVKNDTDDREEKELNNGETCIEEYDFGDDGDMIKKVCGLFKEKGYEYNYGLKLKSAYCYGEYKGKKFGINPHFTCTLGGLNSLDFIFFEPHKNVEITHLLTTPEVQQIYTPRWDYPSDHFSLMTTIRL